MFIWRLETRQIHIPHLSQPSLIGTEQDVWKVMVDTTVPLVVEIISVVSAAGDRSVIESPTEMEPNVRVELPCLLCLLWPLPAEMMKTDPFPKIFHRTLRRGAAVDLWCLQQDSQTLTSRSRGSERAWPFSIRHFGGVEACGI